MDKITEGDREFLRSFEELSLGKKCWNHAAHVRMAWLELERQGSYDRALEKIRTSIRRFNAANGSVGYHETITVAFTRLIHHRRSVGEASWRYEDFIRNNPDLLSTAPFLLDEYYEPERLKTPEAREGFVMPTRKPLPQ